MVIRTGYDLLTFKEQEKKSKIKIFLYWLITQISLTFGNHYIVTSETDKESLKRRRLFQTRKIKVIPNWIDFKNNDQLIKNGFISVGRFEKQKNFDKLIKNWDYVFYLDINMNIHYDVNKILDIIPKNCFMAISNYIDLPIV